MKGFRTALKLMTVLVLFLIPMAAWALEDELIVTVASDATWPPMEMLNENKHLVGFDIDFMNAVAQEAGFKVLIENTAWDGIFAGVASGKYDAIISSVTIDEKRKKMVDFSDPYINAGQVLVVPAASTAKVLADLKGKPVGAQIGTTGAFEINKVEGVVLKAYDELGLAFEDMLAGRIDGIVCDTPIAANYALQKEEYKGKFKIAGEPFTEEYYGIVVKKGNTKLLELINTGIKAVKAKGIDEELKAKWFK
ncbi:basic amino acid ABC transporter substrate-binding protein [Desulfatiferula olefinivorans]